MRALFLSDLHIQDAQDPFYRRLLSWLSGRYASGDKLVLAGDIFDLYLGHQRLFSEIYYEWLSLLKAEIQRGIEVYVIEGNHDFELKADFQSIGCKVICDELKLDLDGLEVYVAHGDLVNREDTSYLALRRFLRVKPTRWLLKNLPQNLVRKIGLWASEQGKKRDKLLPMEWSSKDLQSLRKIFHGFAKDKILMGSDVVVMGHCHDLDEMSVSGGSRVGRYFNLGYAKVHERFLEYNSEHPERQKIDRFRRIHAFE